MIVALPAFLCDQLGVLCVESRRSTRRSLRFTQSPQREIVLVDNLGMSYGITGDIKRSMAVFEYGIKEEPTYPLFYYNMACGFGELGDEDNAIKYLRLAFKYKANMINRERFPDTMTDSSFAKFRKSEKFVKAVAEMKS